MRTHLPVITTAYFLKNGESIVFTTDLKGNIACVNPCLVQVRGFTQDKLLGSVALLLVLSSGLPFLAALARIFWGGYRLHRAIVPPSRQAHDAVCALAGGDLSVPCESSRRDDMGPLLRALRQLKINLQAVMGDVRTHVDSIEAAAASASLAQQAAMACRRS